jgi:hypothetical protein
MIHFIAQAREVYFHEHKFPSHQRLNALEQVNIVEGLRSSSSIF